jgi:hypothetical protein
MWLLPQAVPVYPFRSGNEHRQYIAHFFFNATMRMDHEVGGEKVGTAC